jgi:very-short-patch-repair endonuclease
VTDHVRTLLDVARTAPLPISLPIIDAALHQQPWLLEPLKAEANCRGGERGISRAQRAIHLASPEAESPLETLLRLLILLAGLPASDTQVEVRTPRKTYYADLGYREQRLLLEADGRKHHSEWKKVSDDMVRHNAMVGAGWRVLRFTWSQIMYQPELVIAAISPSALRRRGIGRVNVEDDHRADATRQTPSWPSAKNCRYATGQ